MYDVSRLTVISVVISRTVNYRKLLARTHSHRRLRVRLSRRRKSLVGGRQVLGVSRDCRRNDDVIAAGISRDTPTCYLDAGEGMIGRSTGVKTAHLWYDQSRCLQSSTSCC